MDDGLLRTEAAAGARAGGRPDRLRALLEEWGDTPYARVALLTRYDYFAGADGRSVVPFRSGDGVDLALGSPAAIFSYSSVVRLAAGILCVAIKRIIGG